MYGGLALIDIDNKELLKFTNASVSVFDQQVPRNQK